MRPLTEKQINKLFVKSSNLIANSVAENIISIYNDLSDRGNISHIDHDEAVLMIKDRLLVETNAKLKELTISDGRKINRKKN